MKRHERVLAIVLVFFFLSPSAVRGWRFNLRKSRLTNREASSIGEEIRSLIQGAAHRADQRNHVVQSVFPTLFEALGQRLWEIVRYKPPVGIVIIWVVAHLVLSGRLFRMYPKKSTLDSVLDDDSPSERRAWRLDQADVDYQQHGGVDSTRQRLLHVSLNYILENSVSPPRSNSKRSGLVEEGTANIALESVIQGLGVRSHGSRLQMARDLVKPYSDLLQLSKRDLRIPTLTSNPRLNLRPVIELAASTVETRFLDALLRATRDRLLQTCNRLARTREFWERRVQGTPAFRTTTSHDRDRVRLEIAQAVERSELERLGRIVDLLQRRPPDWSDKYLILALKATDDIRVEKKAKSASTSSLIEKIQNASNLTPWKKNIDVRHWKPASRVVFLNNYSIRWQIGKGLQIRKQDTSNLDGNAALMIVLQAMQQTNAEQTANQAQSWNSECQAILFSVIRDVLHECSGTNSSSATHSISRFDDIQLVWSGCDKQECAEDLRSQILGETLLCIEGLALWRRVGEAKTVQLKNLWLARLARKLNLFGLPGSIGWVLLSFKVHKLLAPSLPSLQTEVLNMHSKLYEILLARVWVPLKGIYDDIMNKNQGIFSAFGLEIEQTSLDNMLRDLGLGDGTAGTRQEALRKATEQYEDTLQSGVVVNALRGKLARQLLLQVQQLKVGLLTALDTIDVLLKGNRIHFQILAVIPAILAATYGARLFVRLLYHLRSKDVRPLFAINAEMTSYLDRMERRLAVSVEPVTNLKRGEIFVFAHRYLVLLEFASPPVPNRLRDSIQDSLQQLNTDLGNPQEYLRLIKEKHKTLAGYF